MENQVRLDSGKIQSATIDGINFHATSSIFGSVLVVAPWMVAVVLIRCLLIASMLFSSPPLPSLFRTGSLTHIPLPLLPLSFAVLN